MSPLYRSLKTVTRQAVLCTLALSIASAAWAQTKVLSVEEHWELKLGKPDADRSAPQTTMVLSPNGSLDGLHFLFTLNHVNIPQYEPGGMQVQLWDGSQFIEERVGASAGALHHEHEVVRWVQRLSLDDDSLTFQVRDGQSDTWGAFGGDDLTIHWSTSLAHLNAYKPGVSLAESQVGYAENRVVSLTLTKLVWVTDDGQVHELNAPIAVDTSLDP